jgi:hypothetical protein
MDGPRHDLSSTSYFTVKLPTKQFKKIKNVTYVVQQAHTQTISHNPGGNNGELK